MKGLLVYASGKTEEIDDPAGNCIYRRESCGECGQHVGKGRKFEVHWAHDEKYDPNKPERMGGILVYVEVPA